jgi:hypothetical protein
MPPIDPDGSSCSLLSARSEGYPEVNRPGKGVLAAGSVSKDCKNWVRASRAGWQADGCRNGRQEELVRGVGSGHAYRREL